ncbi:hypothetical protein [Mycoplasma sp. P36-A1]|uniref:hypothetical protein n=1 Tax=Mycoplasma sp. P36-A1 TaxID=3252900 RepID=UPI003C2DE196
MRISKVKSDKYTYLYVIKSTFENGKNSSYVIEKLGSIEKIMKNNNFTNQQALDWAASYSKKLTEQDNENSKK